MSRRELIILVATGLVFASCGPELTPITIVETQEVEVTRQVKQEVFIIATPELTSTATPETQIRFEDDFETSEGEWDVRDLFATTSYISDGQLVIEVHSKFWTTWVGNPNLSLLDDYVLEVDISHISGPSDSSAGILFRCSADDEKFLQIAIDADGFFSLQEVTFVEGVLDFLEIVPWVLSSAVGRGQAVNHIRLIDDDRQVTVFINDELVTTLPYDVLPPGCPSLFASTPFDQGQAVWEFDNVTVRDIGP